MNHDQAIERIPSGVRGLDRLLNGGFLKGGIYIIQGPPGAGKTTLGNQLCFAHVAGGGAAAYVTLLAEAHARMLQNLRQFEFFDARVIPKSLYYLSAFSTLEGEGLKGLIDLIRREVRGRGASVLVLDGLLAVEESAETHREFKKFVHELQTQVSLANCTTFMLSSGSAQHIRPERTMVDGLIELGDRLSGRQRERLIEVTKFRGSDSLRGQHSFEINSTGIVVYPRLEGVLRYPSPGKTDAGEPVSTGVSELDRMLHGGVPCGTTTMVAGPPGVGKTVLGLHFLSCATPQDPAVYLSFYEPEARAREAFVGLGFDPEKFKPDTIQFMFRPTTEHILDEIGHALLSAIERNGARRVFIDGLDGFAVPVAEPERLVRFFTALSNEFRVRGVTALYTFQTHRALNAEIETPPTGVSTILENWISLRSFEMNGRLRRTLSIAKVRGADFDLMARDFTITPSGIRIEPVAP